jgi:hypothetical protein
MPVTNVTRAWSRDGGEGTSEDGNSLRLAFTEGYQVTHTVDTSTLEILSATGLPFINSFYPGTYARCKKIGPVTKMGPIYSMVGVEYESEVANDNFENPPTNTPPVFKWTDNTTTAEIEQDWDGNPIVTINGEPIRGVTMDLADQSLSITRNYTFFSPWLTHQYRHSVNSDVFAGYAPGTARLVGFSADSVNGDGFSYWTVNATIQFRYPYNTTAAKAWYARTLHQGFYERIGTKYVRAANNGEPTVNPVLLKADGTRETNPANAIWLEWKRYQSLPYAALGLI